mgnify:CR=1 FL=1
MVCNLFSCFCFPTLIIQTIVQYIFIGKLVIAPFIQDCTVFYQQQAGIGTDNRFQGNIIHLAERVFRTGSFTPHLNFFIRRGSQRIKTVAVLHTVIIDFIDKVDIAIVRFLYPVGYQ